MPKYLIPEVNIEKLQKQINSIKKKAGSNIITFNIVGEQMIEDEGFKNLFHKYFEVEVEGNYKINGWEFVATIEHTSQGNIIRSINDKFEIPKRYLDKGPECEHCNKIRSRKDTYLVYNEKTKEFKQLGKTCLREYTGGLSAEVCAQINSLLLANEDAVQMGFRPNTNGKYLENKEVKKIMYNIVKEQGYIPQITISTFLKALSDKNITKAKDEDIKPIDEWVDTLNVKDHGYFRNASLAWKLKYIEYRDLALIGSLINSYFKAKNIEAQSKVKQTNHQNSEYVGNIGDKITFKINSYRVLYTKDNTQYNYYAPDSYVHEIIDDKGNVYIWATTKELEGVLEITATVKNHKEYRGIKQTIITHGKVKYKESDKETLEKQKEQNKKSMEEIEAFLSSIDDN